MLKILMQFGLMKFKCLFKNLQRIQIADLKIKLVPLTYYWWKKEFWRKGVMLFEFPVVCILILGIKLNKYGGDKYRSIL